MDDKQRAIEALEKAGFRKDGYFDDWSKDKVMVTLTGTGRCHVSYLPLEDLSSVLSPLTLEMVWNVVWDWVAHAQELSMETDGLRDICQFRADRVADEVIGRLRQQIEGGTQGG